jgi:hypothetical protein
MRERLNISKKNEREINNMEIERDDIFMVGSLKT